MERILILSASFGEGHNSAARGLAAGLRLVMGGRVEVMVRDLVREAEPFRGALLQDGYQFAITHLPWVWRQLYEAAERLPFDDERLLFLARVERLLCQELERLRPRAVVATFPLYAHLLGKVTGGSAPCPFFTVVTDSISINRVWISRAATHYLAADEISAGELRRRGVPAEKVHVTGFPVDPLFGRECVQPAAEQARRVLFFPSASTERVRIILQSLLREGPPGLELTVAMGRHSRRLEPLRAEAALQHPDRAVRWLGWSSDIPSQMAAHDLVISKAGGATTHECLAAGRPLLISHVVPGQEEGNAELILRRRSGFTLDRPEHAGPFVRQLFASPQWAAVRACAWSQRRPDGALAAARLVQDAL